ncbi:hypothetical protein HPB52_007704 [Rhipicephalus sanguineus]|uniref:Cytochrome P450 n=1 Tax=Rhipicephalus sanguineus TaxID=34632 RepID=A0A9D4T8U1_RHISA|nr:hypothetical protein HPB52_007704 [Rhipicephalus sanguineus]
MVTDPAKKPYDRIREHLMSSRHKKFKTASKEAETAGTSQQTLFDMSCRQRAKETEADGVIHDFVRALAYSGISMHQADGPLGDFARKYCKAAKTMPTGQRLRLKYLKEAFDKDMEKIRDDMRDVKVSVIVDESPDITGVPTINTLLCYYSQKNVKKHVVLVDVGRVNASNSYTVASAVSKARLTVGKTWKDVVAVATDSAEYMRKMVREICQAEGIQILHVKDIAHLIHPNFGPHNYSSSLAVIFNVIKDLSKDYEGMTFKAYLGVVPVVAVLTGKLKSDKPFLYAFLKPWLGHKSLLMIGGDPWRSKRKMFMQAFQANAMENYSGFIEKCADGLVARIDKMLKEAPDEPIRCLENVQKCALDIIGHVALGVDLGVQGETHGNYGGYFNFRNEFTVVHPYMFEPVVTVRATTEDAASADDAAQESVMNKRKEELVKISNQTVDSHALPTIGDASGSLFLDSLLLQHMKAPSSYTLDGVRKDADFMMFAETLRLCPPFPYIGKILDQDLTIEGRTLPKGVACFIIMYSLHRNPNEFEKPDEYIPERFMSEENSHRHPFSFIPFSAGPKNCIGQKFVMMEIKIVLAKILSKFTVESTCPIEELQMTFDIVLKAKGGLPVLFRKRKQS